MNEQQRAMVERGAEVVRKIRKVFPEAILAGGYLRDVLLGIEPKDMDIFVGPKRAEHADDLCIRMAEEVGVGFFQEFNLTYASMEVNRIFSSGERLGECPIQVIELDKVNPVDRVGEHDFGLCQVWHDGGSLCMTGHYARDMAWKICTLVHCENEHEHARSMRRWERLKEKLEPLGFSLVDRTEWAQK